VFLRGGKHSTEVVTEAARAAKAEKYLERALRVAQIAAMLSSDYPGSSLNALYIPGLSKGMIEAPNLFGAAVGLYRQDMAPLIAFNGGDGRAFNGTTPGEAWPGKDYYIDVLAQCGVPRTCLIPTGPGVHSREEVEALIKMAKERRWQRIGFITIPYHYPRAFCFLVKAMDDFGWHPDVFALNTPATNWYLEMGASQGKGTTTPEQAAYDDVAKLLDQIEKGWAAPPEKVLAYLRTRER
jgi:hypothetical protein